MAAVPQHSKMVLVLLGSVFLHADSHNTWLVPWYREHDTKTLWLFKVRSVNSKASSLFPTVIILEVLFLKQANHLSIGKFSFSPISGTFGSGLKKAQCLIVDTF